MLIEIIDRQHRKNLGVSINYFSSNESATMFGDRN
jgi:hypothetical protein